MERNEREKRDSVCAAILDPLKSGLSTASTLLGRNLLASKEGQMKGVDILATGTAACTQHFLTAYCDKKLVSRFTTDSIRAPIVSELVRSVMSLAQGDSPGNVLKRGAEASVSHIVSHLMDKTI